MTTRGPVNGRHVSYIYWFKIMSLAGVDPATSGQGGETWEEPPTGAPLVVPCYIYGKIYYKCLHMCIVWGATGLGLSPSPWSHIVLHMTQCYTIRHARGCVFVPTVIQMTRHLSFDHWLVEREPMFILARGRMGHTTLPLTVRG
jgi:hypothetical protein